LEHYELDDIGQQRHQRRQRDPGHEQQRDDVGVALDPLSDPAAWRLLVATVLAASVVGASSCSAGDSGADEPHGAYYADIKGAAKNASNDWERGVLSDGVITRAEYEEAVQRFVACGKDHGTTIIPEDHYGLYTYAIPGGDPDDVSGTCSKGTTSNVEAFYGESLTNPHRRDWAELVTECLVRTGVAPHGFSTDDYRLAQATAQQRGGDGTHVFPFDVDDERFNQCNYNPSYK
jgi:hypothetical protein